MDNLSFSLDITIWLIIITVGISLYAWQNQNLMQSWVMHPVSVRKNNEWWRFLTSGFLHADYGHLFFNMFSFYAFGRTVEANLNAYFGPTTGLLLYLLLYLGAIILSEVPTYLKHNRDNNYYSLGASGGVAAIIFSSIYFNPMNELLIFPIPFPIQGYIFGALYLIYSYYQSKRGADGINHSAHFYGALFGFVLSILLVPGHIPNFIGMILGR